MRCERKCNTLSGFTVIELLVVIAIIGVLSGVLLPVIISSKESAKSAGCQSNLRQLYLAFELYADNWNGMFPCPGGEDGDLSYWAQEREWGGINPYLKGAHQGSGSVYCCPSYTGDYRSEWSPRTYGMNSFLRTPCDRSFPSCTKIMCGIRKTNILQPSSTILLYEGMPEDRTNVHGEGYVYRCGDWTLVRGYIADKKGYQKSGRPWHRERNNYLFCDGHIETRVPEKYPQFKGPTSPENNLWYANKLR